MSFLRQDIFLFGLVCHFIVEVFFILQFLTHTDSVSQTAVVILLLAQSLAMCQTPDTAVTESGSRESDRKL